MSSIKDKNLLFYSVHPNDEFSKEFMAELEKNANLKKQFILVCVNDPNIRIPDKIKQLGKVPVLIVAGFNKPIFGKDAVSWSKNNTFQEKANGSFEYGALGDDNSKFAFLGDEFKTSDYNQYFNNDYNNGFVKKDATLNKTFTNVTADAHITTFDDQNEMKKDVSGQLEQRLAQLRQQRDTDVPKPVRRIGGLEDNPNQQHQQPQQNFYNTSSQGNGGGNGGGSGGAPTYNPNPFADQRQPQQQQGGFQQGKPLPFAMPMAPGRTQGLPFNMPSMQSGQGARRPNLPFL
jgi:hypothetical protein